MPSDDRESPGQALKRLRGDKNQTELAAFLGKSQASISNYENGLQVIPIDIAVRLGRLFNVSATAFNSNARPNGDVFVIFAAAREAWQKELAAQLQRQLHESGQACRTLLPRGDYDWQEHSEHRAQVLRDKAHYVGGIVVTPIWGIDEFEQLRQFAKALAKPVVFVDQHPPVHEAQIPEKVSYVTVSDESGGTAAARAVLKLSRDLGEDRIKRGLVIAGEAKPARFEAFRQVLARHNIRDIAICTGAAFNEDRAAELTLSFLANGIWRNKPYDFIFCQADSMTAGCMKVVEALGKVGCPVPSVIGYDGVPTTLQLVDRGEMAAVVIQDAVEVARATVEQLLALCNGERPVRKVIKLDAGLKESLCHLQDEKK